MQQEKTPNKQPKLRFSSKELTVLAILFSATIVVSTGIQMGNALFPALSRLVNVPISTVTLLVSVWAFTELLSPLFGPPSDRYGHTTFVLIGLGTFTLGNLLCIVAPNFLALLTFQVLVGLGYGVFSFSASAVIGDVFAYDMRARAMGIVRVAVSVTALVGVPVAAAIADWATARASFGTIAGIGLAILVLALTRLPRQSRQATYPQSTEAEANLSQTIREITHQRSAIVSLLTLGVWALIPTGVFIYLAAWLEKAFVLTETQIGLAFSVAGVGGLLGNAFTAAWADRLGKKRSAVLGLVVLSTMALLLPHLPSLIAVLCCFAVLVAALEVNSASFVTLMTELTPTSRGTLMSLVTLAIGIGTGAAPLLLRPLWESGGYAAVTLALGIVGLSVAIIIGLFISEPKASPVTSGQEDNRNLA